MAGSEEGIGDTHAECWVLRPVAARSIPTAVANGRGGERMAPCFARLPSQAAGFLGKPSGRPKGVVQSNLAAGARQVPTRGAIRDNVGADSRLQFAVRPRSRLVLYSPS